MWEHLSLSEHIIRACYHPLYEERETYIDHNSEKGSFLNLWNFMKQL